MFKSNYLAFIIPLLLLVACQQKQEDTNALAQVLAKPPVKATTVKHGDIYQTETYNAFSKYLKKEYVRAPITGYIQTLTVNPGEEVNSSQTLGSLQTQEARALSDVKIKGDSITDFTGLIALKSPRHGIINTINFQAGAFVQQGDQLMDIIALNSIVFIVNIPYEDINTAKKGMALTITLPNRKSLQATLGNPLPIDNSTSQVQSFILHPDSPFYVPENLNATATLKKGKMSNAQTIDKQAILTNETQTEFWVMQLINDSTAVRVDVKKGIESGNEVELQAPIFNPGDRILFQGQYGLPDTADVKVIK